MGYVFFWVGYTHAYIPWSMVNHYAWGHRRGYLSTASKSSSFRNRSSKSFFFASWGGMARWRKLDNQRRKRMEHVI